MQNHLQVFEKHHLHFYSVHGNPQTMLWFGTWIVVANMQLWEYDEEPCEEPFLLLDQFNIY